MQTFNHQAASELSAWLLAQHTARERFVPLRWQGRKLTAAEAYAVQDELVAALRDKTGAGIAGYKVGLTSQVMQTMCGIDRPAYGRILDTRVHQSGVQLAHADYGRLGLEFEIAVRLGADVTVPADRASVAACVDAVCPAFELIDDRGSDYSLLDGPSLIADNAWNAGVVLGTWQALPTDLAARQGRVALDGNPLDQGLIGDAMSHPLDVVVWLAEELAAHGRHLRAGEIVMTGSVVKTRYAEAGQAWAYAVENMGTVTLRA